MASIMNGDEFSNFAKDIGEGLRVQSLKKLNSNDPEKVKKALREIRFCYANNFWKGIAVHGGIDHIKERVSFLRKNGYTVDMKNNVIVKNS